MVSFEDFMNIEMVVVKVIEAKEHPNADRLYLLKVDTGEGERQLVAGIRASYSAEELVGRRAVFVKNLEPAIIRGEESQGMILAASDERGISLLTPDREVALGSRVR